MAEVATRAEAEAERKGLSGEAEKRYVGGVFNKIRLAHARATQPGKGAAHLNRKKRQAAKSANDFIAEGYSPHVGRQKADEVRKHESRREAASPRALAPVKKAIAAEDQAYQNRREMENRQRRGQATHGDVDRATREASEAKRRADEAKARHYQKYGIQWYEVMR